MSPMRLAQPAALLLGALAFASAGTAQDAPAPPADPAAQETPATAEPDGLIVRDLFVLQADVFGDAANAPSDFETTLFNNAPRRRRISERPNDTPMPLGTVTLDGELAEPAAIRIDIGPDNGRFLGHWPKGVAGGDFLAWFDIRPVPTPAGRMRIPDEHWLNGIRDTTDTLSFNTRGHIDRFFAYDATFPYRPTITLEGNTEDGYTAVGDGLAPSELVLVARPSDTGWVSGLADTTTGTVTLAPVDSPAQALAPVRKLLAERGYCDAQADTALAMLEESAFGNASMTLIYLLPHDQADTLLPLSVSDPSAEIVRTGLVVVGNAEPDIVGTVARLVEQLGSERWAQRDAAQRALIGMGRAAIEVVRQNADHPDAEVAYRVEQIIAEFESSHE
jgi:hypothetical protein